MLFVLHFVLHHGWPSLKEEHEQLKVLPLFCTIQQLQKEGVSFLLIFHILYLNLRGRVSIEANQPGTDSLGK